MIGQLAKNRPRFRSAYEILGLAAPARDNDPFAVEISPNDTVLLAVAGLLAGVMNAVAGGGTFLTFPALVFTGIPSVAANQTSTIAVFPGQIASFWAYRNISGSTDSYRRRSWPHQPSWRGTGRDHPLNTSTPAFDRLVPWLLLGATLMFAFGNHLRRRLGLRLVSGSGEIGWGALGKAAFIQLIIGIYGGSMALGPVFSELAVLDMLGLENIHLANAQKVILTAAFNTLAVVIFLAVGKIYWAAALIVGACRHRRRIRRCLGSTETSSGLGEGLCDRRGSDHDNLFLFGSNRHPLPFPRAALLNVLGSFGRGERSSRRCSLH